MTLYKAVIYGNPATKKNSGRIIKNGKKTMLLPSAAYSKYEAMSLWKLPRPGTVITTPCNIRCVYYMGNARRVDITNLLSATHDILVRGRIIEDDNSKIVKSVDGSRVYIDRENPRVEIEITEVQE